MVKKIKKTTISHINKKDNKCLQYSVKVALNYEEIKKVQKKTTKFKPFILNFNWERINLPSGKDDRKKVEKK